MRAGSVRAELVDKPTFHIFRDGVFQAFCLIVNFVPLHSEHFVKHSFHQVVPEPKFIRNLPSHRSQGDSAFAVNLNQFVST